MAPSTELADNGQRTQPETVDYLVIGSGATAMAFVDTMLTETDATFAMVDRRHVPGGHWNDAYLYVRLHQPSQYYGVASVPLGRGRKDETGFNRGYYELASGVEVTAYFHDVMEDRFLPSGRVSYHPSSDYDPTERTVTSLLSGRRTEIAHRTLVDASYLTASIPLTHDRPFDVAPGVTCEPPNNLPRLAAKHRTIAIIGGGKTAMDSVTWLLGHGFPAERITWVVPRDSWLINRSIVQPGPENFHATFGALAAQTEACATAGSLDDLCLAQEAAGVWLRLSPDVWPQMFHAATISEHELAEIRKIDNIVRLGHVQRIEPGRLVLAKGDVACAPGTLHIDCTASAANTNVGVREPVFADGRINLQMIRSFQPCFSAALLGWIEAHIDDDRKASFALPTPMVDTVHDWLTVQADELRNVWAWSSEPELNEWVANCRLNALSGMLRNVDLADPDKQTLVERMLTAAPAAVDNLSRLAADVNA
ncbi:MAG: NAD(P)/FAD-dependent oxidoreductase [Actinomycetota bacterium]